MFFSPELLARRDSGFGLLWLAATLGSKSTFKKLSRRSVLTADINQLCELIAHPEEPLALRLSSNLMVGVARVYKIKQEIFMNDVTNCVASLKKVVQEIQTAAAKDTSHQMAHSNTRPSAFTISADTNALYFMDFDALVADWDEFLDLEGPSTRVQDANEDEEYNPNAKKSKQKNALAKPPPLPEEVRADMVTLKEHHDHLLSNSFDLSFQGSGGGGADASSSQAEPFTLGDNLFPIDNDLGIDFGLGDELARELGEGWGASPAKDAQKDRMDVDEGPLDPVPMDEVELGIGSDFMLGRDNLGPGSQGADERPPSRFASVDVQMDTPVEKRTTGSQENPAGAMAPQPPASPATSFSRALLSQDEELSLAEPAPLADVTADHRNKVEQAPKKTHKRTRLLLDARTELTDEELKIARAQYLAQQCHQRREFNNKKLEKASVRVVEDLIWGVPTGIEAPALVDFWQQNFKVQVEARTGLMQLHSAEEPPKKRRKVQREDANEEIEKFNMQNDELGFGDPDALNNGNDVEMGLGNEGNAFDAGWGDDMEPIRLRSSEEPGQARQMSKPPSDIGANFSFDLGSGQQAGSQRSSLFPWDNAGAGPSSSVDKFGGGSDRISVDRAEIRLRGSSLSRRESLPTSQSGSVGARGLSPADVGIRGSQLIGEDFVFSGVEPENTQNLDGTQTLNTQMESQRSDLNLITLERNSFNFLEYTKMQQQALPSGAESISSEVVVPKMTSTRHVAAAAFYHCLVLATKNLLRVDQPIAYEPINIRVL